MMRTAHEHDSARAPVSARGRHQRHACRRATCGQSSHTGNRHRRTNKRAADQGARTHTSTNSERYTGGRVEAALMP